MRLTRTLTALTLTPLVVGLLAATAAAGSADPADEGSGHTPVWDLGTDGERYVAFGDSFASGPGISPQRSGSCARSASNFSSVVAAALDVQSFTDATCGGAVIDDLWRDQRDNAPQLDALGTDTTLVTFGTLGGNDMGLVQLATACVIGDCLGWEPLEPIAEVRQELMDGVAEARLRAPNAVIAMIGYGTYLPPGGCAGLPLTAPESDFLQGKIDELSDAIGEVAEAQDVAFVDLREIPGVADHTACATPSQQWIRALNAYGDGAQFHPSCTGMRAMAAQVATVVEATWAGDDTHPIAYDDRTGTPDVPVACPTIADPPTPPTTTSPTPTTSPSPTSVPTPAPTPVSDLVAAVQAAQDSITVSARCGTVGKRRVVRIRVHGGDGLIDRAVFRVGAKQLKADRSAPYVVTRGARALARTKGPLWVRVTASSQGAALAERHLARRPSCLR